MILDKDFTFKETGRKKFKKSTGSTMGNGLIKVDSLICSVTVE